MAIDLIDAIESYHRLIVFYTPKPNSVYFQILSLREKSKHKVTIYKMVIKRLEQRYNRILTELTALKSQ
jgi:hypothetical protein